MAYDPNNIFALILKGDMPCVKVYEDEHTLAFMDVMPQTEGHTLVIPKVPAENIFDLPEEAGTSLIATTQKVAKAVKKALNPGGIMLAQLNEAPAGQSVFHIHFHVIPRNEGVNLGMHSGGEMLGADVLEPIAAKIREAIE